MNTERKYLRPHTVKEAVDAALGNGSFRYLAGGTDLLVNKFQGNAEMDCLIDLTGIDGLREIRKSQHHPPGAGEVPYLLIGSLVTLEELTRNELIKEHFPALAQAAHEAASPMLRKTATVGGNILCENRCSFYNQSEWWRTAVGYCLKCDGDVCIATGGTKACFSKFVSDTAPVFISMNALIEITDEAGTNVVPLESIYTGDGIAPRKLSVTSIITHIKLPLGRQFKTVFKKLRPREAVDFTSLTTAVTKDQEGKLRIVLGGVDPKPVLIEGSIHNDPLEIIKEALKKSRVVDNDFYSRSYRKEMIQVFLKQSLTALTE